MTQILLLDTATRSATLALGNSEERRVVRSDPSERNSRDLMALVRALFESSGGLASARVDAIGFNRGPGSYTGSRLAASVVQGIAYVKKCPVVELNTLELLYLSGVDQLEQASKTLSPGTCFLVAVESKVGEYFWTWFKSHDGTHTPQLTVGDADALVTSIHSSNVVVIMNSSMRDHAVLREIDNACWVEPRVELAFDIAISRLNKGLVVDALNAEPLYGQDNIGWKTLAEQRAAR
ncbi:MAG: tRNA (adenosine(37)-N6)-threonylcarbamoyltransferase complex dimerization subunit type 1 TsaB [Halieaceae bacterium]|nr:tRNA (adenosine(37)-N6)-threonylcarbamoyltransferase complex dimerization subunit type 1 TsaB [Halieaceae bacterium]